MSTLIQLCQDNIVNNILSLPPQIQESIIQTTKEKMKEEVKIELKKEMIDKIKKETISRVSEQLSNMIADISVDIVNSMTSNNIFRNDYYSMYNNYDPYIVSLAVYSAENIINSLEQRYVEPSFSNNHNEESDTEENSDY